MYEGTVDAFNAMIGSLPPVAVGGRQTMRWEQPSTNLRGYTAWMTPWDACFFQQNTPNVLGISFEPRLRLTPPPLPLVPLPPDALLRRDIELGLAWMVNTEGKNSSKDHVSDVPSSSSFSVGATANATTVLTSRQISTDTLVLQSNPEGNEGLLASSIHFYAPKFVGVQYWKYPGYAHAYSGGDTSLIYVIDSGLAAATGDEFGHPAITGDRIADSFEVVGTTQGRGDLHGHGTAMAASAVGRRVGVSRSARVIPVKFTDSYPTTEAEGAHQLFQAPDSGS